MSLLDELASLDRKRKRLAVHEERARRIFFWPALRRKFLERFADRWHDVTRRRSRVLALIQADPVLRAELRARERAALAAAETRKSDARPGKQDFTDMADAVIALKATERKARDACQDAIWYYKSGAWKQHGVALEEVSAVMGRFRDSLATACLQRAKLQETLEASVAQHYPGGSEHILERERIMRQAEMRAGLTQTDALDRQPAPNAFETWLKARVPGIDAPEPDRERKRGRGR